ncbi:MULTISPECIES: YncE family protein [Mycobacterium]|uniref:YVTN family beta-propeller repeat protein n=1 Tax=Mycobacterium pseudoshottsii TaxID=265949 RepID=A0A9N7QR72_9MYCO|nr:MULTISPECIES: YncE family protein [Mycobacterium]EPQ45961.1 hypothetical protein MMSP_1722 [Mycobacterium sp. 012931]MBC9862167.1 hypothetical protein [Mycobacterium pseudoshottsii]BDN84294.1 hypothetical protein NJB1907Z4_C45090 [Mycobacterium pseudoshottsii]BEH78678.1 hypothetical protein YM3MPS_44810 [Mycobacterium pseudoshottsii]
MSDVNGQQTGWNDRDGGDVQVFELGTAPDFPTSVEIAVANGPIGDIGISPDGSRLMVTNYGDNSVSVIDTDTCRVVETITGLDEAFAVTAGGPAANRAYVSTVSTAYDAIAVIDVATNAVVSTHPLALSVSDLAASSDGKYVYASRNGARGADIAVLDTATGRVDVVDIAPKPGLTTECVRVSADGNRGYVGANGPSGGQPIVVATHAESELNPVRGGRARSRGRNGQGVAGSVVQQFPRDLRIIDTIEIGSSVRDVAISPDGTTAYVASCGADFGAVIDVVDTRTRKITGTRKIEEIGGLITRLSIGGNGERAYLVSEDRVTVLSARSQDVIGTVRVNQPSAAIESPGGDRLYVADYSGTVTMTLVDLGVSAIDNALCQGLSADWVMPELLQFEAALA